jgi:hypothetical protein
MEGCMGRRDQPGLTLCFSLVWSLFGTQRSGGGVGVGGGCYSILPSVGKTATEHGLVFFPKYVFELVFSVLCKVSLKQKCEVRPSIIVGLFSSPG